MNHRTRDLKTANRTTGEDTHGYEKPSAGWEVSPLAAEVTIVGRPEPRWTAARRTKVVVMVEVGTAGDRYPLHVTNSAKCDDAMQLRAGQRIRFDGRIVKAPAAGRPNGSSRHSTRHDDGRATYIEVLSFTRC
jgi:hypothetical protein